MLLLRITENRTRYKCRVPGGKSPWRTLVPISPIKEQSAMLNRPIETIIGCNGFDLIIARQPQKPQRPY
jgi:hypothetical protein